MLGHYLRAGVDSLKIEGRMKGPIYVATASKVYREALDHWEERDRHLPRWRRELQNFSHRDYTLGALLSPAGPDSIHRQRDELHRSSNYQVLGTVVDARGGEAIVQVKNPFDLESEVEVLPFRGPAISWPFTHIKSLGGKAIARARPSTLVRLPAIPGVEVERWNMLRKRC